MIKCIYFILLGIISAVFVDFEKCRVASLDCYISHTRLNIFYVLLRAVPRGYFMICLNAGIMVITICEAFSQLGEHRRFFYREST